MSTQPNQRDPWRWPSIFLWLIFFLLGIWPELSFTLLRAAGYVFSQNAVVNSYKFITWSLTGFVAYFAYHRCLEAEYPPIEALVKASQLGVLAFVAFVDVPIQHIGEIQSPTILALVMSTVLLKFLAWAYLYTLLVRYYWTGNVLIIARSLSWLGLNPPKQTEHAPPRTSSEGKSAKSGVANHYPPMEEHSDQH